MVNWKKGSIERIIKRHVNEKMQWIRSMRHIFLCFKRNESKSMNDCRYNFGFLWLWKKKANRKPCDKMLVSVCCTINAFNPSEFIHRTPLDLHKCFSNLFFSMLWGIFFFDFNTVINFSFDRSSKWGKIENKIWFSVNWIMTVRFECRTDFCNIAWNIDGRWKIYCHCWKSNNNLNFENWELYALCC